MRLALLTIFALRFALPAAAGQEELPCEVLAISAGILKKGPFGLNSGELPWRSSELGSGPSEWASGTSVLLLAKLPAGSRVLPQGARLLSFVDDTGKNLAKPPEGASAEPHGIPGRDRPLVVSANEAGTEALIALRSLKCPNKGANKISGEVEIALTSAPEASAESKPVPARAGTKTAAGPVEIAITRFGRQDVRSRPPGMPAPTQELQNELGIQFRTTRPDTALIKVEILNGLNRTLVREITGIQADSANMTYLSSVPPTLSAVLFRVTYATGAAKTSSLVRFSTGLGLYED